MRIGHLRAIVSLTLLMVALAARGGQYTPPAVYGYPLISSPRATIWWCEATYKVRPDFTSVTPTAAHARPAGAPAHVRGMWMAAARRERVALQLVVRPISDTGGLRVTASDLSGPMGASIPKACVLIRTVGYVNVRVRTDEAGAEGEWPDPLLPMGPGWRPQTGRNNPLWITVTVPADAPAGDYRGSISLQGRLSGRVPLTVHVWNFALPEKTDLRSGFGIELGDIRSYHHLSTDRQAAKVWDLYMRDFAAHRLCPYEPMSLASLGMTAADSSPNEVKLDWSGFDREAKRYLDGLGFNAFRIGFPGLGGGRYPDVDYGSILGHAAGTPEYDALMTSYGRQYQEHLAAHGWLKKAYVYWYDEPRPIDYPIVNRGMHRLHVYAPRLTRLITEGFSDELIGNIDLWCPLSMKFVPRIAAERQRKGEQVWWYICTVPKAPWVGEFIDHPAIEMRMWMWQTWKWNIQGILIWATNYWNTGGIYKGEPQDPYVDTQSYMGPKTTDVYGNGDGRFFYPPYYPPGSDRTKPCLDGPVDSLRWELLGEGVQDWEYLHLLDRLVREAARRDGRAASVEKARAMLRIPDSICRNMAHYTRDPQDLYRRRVELAQSIESLLRRDRSVRGVSLP